MSAHGGADESPRAKDSVARRRLVYSYQAISLPPPSLPGSIAWVSPRRARRTPSPPRSPPRPPPRPPRAPPPRASLPLEGGVFGEHLGARVTRPSTIRVSTVNSPECRRRRAHLLHRRRAFRARDDEPLHRRVGSYPVVRRPGCEDAATVADANARRSARHSAPPPPPPPPRAPPRVFLRQTRLHRRARRQRLRDAPRTLRRERSAGRGVRLGGGGEIGERDPRAAAAAAAGVRGS